MKEQLERLERKSLEAIVRTETQEALEGIRLQVLGKKGDLTAILKGLGQLPPEDRKAFGALANHIKGRLGKALAEQEEALLEKAAVLDFTPDLTVPGLQPNAGGLHPITQMCHDLNDAFHSLNFAWVSDSDLCSEAYAFDALNFPEDHPARESMDSYWIAGTEEKQGAQRLCLRPHLTGASVAYLRAHGAPCRIVYPGRVYRNENTDARHERAFFQYEALIVDEDISFASGHLLIQSILEKVFGRPVKTRMRAGFFPFVEPGFEIDMHCLACEGKGCRVCKQVGWIEVMPGGIPHPNVLKAAGLDPERWTGFYINIGLDRLVMMRYGVDDVRLFHSGDLRFLQQFV